MKSTVCGTRDLAHQIGQEQYATSQDADQVEDSSPGNLG